MAEKAEDRQRDREVAKLLVQCLQDVMCSQCLRPLRSPVRCAACGSLRCGRCGRRPPCCRRPAPRAHSPALRRAARTAALLRAAPRRCYPHLVKLINESFPSKVMDWITTTLPADSQLSNNLPVLLMNTKENVQKDWDKIEVLENTEMATKCRRREEIVIDPSNEIPNTIFDKEYSSAAPRRSSRKRSCRDVDDATDRRPTKKQDRSNKQNVKQLAPMDVTKNGFKQLDSMKTTHTCIVHNSPPSVYVPFLLKGKLHSPRDTCSYRPGVGAKANGEQEASPRKDKMQKSDIIINISVGATVVDVVVSNGNEVAVRTRQTRDVAAATAPVEDVELPRPGGEVDIYTCTPAPLPGLANADDMPASPPDLVDDLPACPPDLADDVPASPPDLADDVPASSPALADGVSACPLDPEVYVSPFPLNPTEDTSTHSMDPAGDAPACPLDPTDKASVCPGLEPEDEMFKCSLDHTDASPARQLNHADPDSDSVVEETPQRDACELPRELTESVRTPLSIARFASDVRRCSTPAGRVGAGAVLAGSCLNAREMAVLRALCAARGWRCVDTYVPHLTHLVVAVDTLGRAQRSVKYMCALAAGKWIVGVVWLQHVAGLPPGAAALGEEQYEALDWTGQAGPRRSRLSHTKLFQGFTFYCEPPFAVLNRDTLHSMLESAGARVAASIQELHDVVQGGGRALLLAEHAPERSDHFLYLSLSAGTVAVSVEWVHECLGQYRLRSVRQALLCPAGPALLPPALRRICRSGSDSDDDSHTDIPSATLPSP